MSSPIYPRVSFRRCMLSLKKFHFTSRFVWTQADISRKWPVIIQTRVWAHGQNCWRTLLPGLHDHGVACVCVCVLDTYETSGAEAGWVCGLSIDSRERWSKKHVGVWVCSRTSAGVCGPDSLCLIKPPSDPEGQDNSRITSQTLCLHVQTHTHTHTHNTAAEDKTPNLSVVLFLAF